MPKRHAVTVRLHDTTKGIRKTGFAEMKAYNMLDERMDKFAKLPPLMGKRAAPDTASLSDPLPAHQRRTELRSPSGEEGREINGEGHGRHVKVRRPLPNIHPNPMEIA